MWSLRTAQRAIIVGGCLATAYTQLTMSPATIEFALSHGASGVHIGILGALPTGMLFMQFVAAVLVNHLRYRRWLWLAVSLVQRLAYVPVALGPLLVPSLSDAVWIWGLLAVTAVNHGMMHFTNPLWLSWMGDYLPHDGLNQFWGLRQRWMQWTAALSLLGGAILLVRSGLAIAPAYAVLIGVGAVLGVVDILLFLRVEEPPVSPMPQPTLRRVLSAPFHDRLFRSFIVYACFWNFAAMAGAPFISLFLLQYVGMDLYHVLLLWSCSWVGGAVCSRLLGAMAEKHGHRPLLVLCTACKSLNMTALLLTPPSPDVAFWILVPVFMIDAVLNAGILIASNGFLLKNSPQENRTMYIAAGTALAGMVGGATAIVAGGVLTLTSAWSVTIGGLVWGGFHVIFAASLVFRLAAIGLARRIHEPKAGGTRFVALQMVGATPLRFVRFPVGLYRSWRFGEEPFDQELPKRPAA